MTIETPGGSPADSPVVAAPTARSLFTRPMVLAGVGGACVLGLAVGLLARPELAPDTRAPGSMKPVEQMRIEIDGDEPLPPVKGAKLELLPPGLKVSAPALPRHGPRFRAPGRPRRPSRPRRRGRASTAPTAPAPPRSWSAPTPPSPPRTAAWPAPGAALLTPGFR